jgi:hypothetical protein
VGDGEGAVRAGALGVHSTLRDHFAVKVRQLLDQPDILQKRRPARTRRHDVHIVGNGCAGGVGQKRSLDLVAHRKLLAGSQHSSSRRRGKPGETRLHRGWVTAGATGGPGDRQIVNRVYDPATTTSFLGSLQD